MILAFACLVVSVHDGDTFRCAERAEAIRLAGIDAPELHGCHGRRGRVCVAGNGEASRHARAQGFPDDYVLDPIVRKFIRGKWVERPLTIAEQISAIGNSVCPPVARALVAANQPGLADLQMAA